MKKGDMVKVNWPTGKGGPYKVVDTLSISAIVIMDIYREKWTVSTDKVEVVKPEIEQGRLVTSGSYVGYSDYCHEDGSYSIVANGHLVGTHLIVEPVHRRWDELSREERSGVESTLGLRCLPVDKFKSIYELITGEEHP